MKLVFNHHCSNFSFKVLFYTVGSSHRRRIKPEEKVKVVAAILGTEFIQVLAAHSCFALGRFEDYGGNAPG